MKYRFPEIRLCLTELPGVIYLMEEALFNSHLGSGMGSLQKMRFRGSDHISELVPEAKEVTNRPSFVTMARGRSKPLRME